MQSFPLFFKVFSDAEGRCELNAENERKVIGKTFHQYLVSFNHYIKSDLGHNLPSGCHYHFEEYC